MDIAAADAIARSGHRSGHCRLAHLAGALGVPVWVALSFAAEAGDGSRERSDSPWYPSMRLFRQKRWGDWAQVFERMAAELPPLIETREDSVAEIAS